MLYVMRKNEFEAMFRIMEDSFPSDEYRPFEEQRFLLDDPRYCVYVNRDADGGDVNAFLAVWHFDGFAFVEHFAVRADARNRGLGAVMLCELERLLQCRLCLEVELPSTPIARRRIAFYERAGFTFHDFDYTQPPISKGKHEVPLRLMTTGGPLSFEQLTEIKTILYREVYRVG